MRMVLVFIISLSILLSLLGCSTTGQMIQEKKKNEADNEKAGIINENFDPALLGDDEIDFKKTISPESKSDNFDDLLFETPESKPLPEEMDGFRVQICAVSDEQKAKQAQRDAIIQFMDNEVYLEYHAPYYKIRIGNCISRFEAEQLQKLAMQKGFADAWVVKTKVKPNLNKENPPEKNVEAPPN